MKRAKRAFDLRAAVARLSARSVERADSIYAIEQAVLQFNQLVKAAREKYPESIDLQGLVPFRHRTKIGPELLHDAIGRLLDGVDAVHDEDDSDLPLLSEKSGILRAESQIDVDYSTYLEDLGGLGLLFVDIDHFKALNTRYTESIVDMAILAPFQRLLLEIIQSRGFAYSVGGDEFIVLLRNADADETEAFAGRLVRSVHEHAFSIEGATEILSLSVGVACHPRDAKTLAELRQMANKAENAAKARGRDRVVCWPLNESAQSPSYGEE